MDVTHRVYSLHSGSTSMKGCPQRQEQCCCWCWSCYVQKELREGRRPSNREKNFRQRGRAMARREPLDDARIRVVQVVAGEAHTLALTAAGGVYSWGRGLFGRMGVAVFQDELIPTHIAIGANPNDDDGAGSSHSGSSHSSQGRKDTSRAHSARDRVDGAARSKATQVAAGAYHNLALTAGGSVWSWGYNAYGQLGRGKTASQPSPVTFTYRTPAEEVRRGGAIWLKGATTDAERKQPKIFLVSAGGMISSAVDVDGALWLWGAVPNPSEYSDSYSSRNSLSVVSVEKPERVRGLLGLRVYRVAVGNEHILALVEGRDDSELDCYAWGNNQFGQLGLGDFRDRPYPQVVKALAASAVGSIVDLACGAFHTAVLAVKDDHPADLVLEPHSPKSRRSKQAWDVVQDSPTPTPRHSFFRTHQPVAEQAESFRNNSPKLRARQDSETSSSLKSALGSSRMSSSRSLGQFTQPARSERRFSLEGRLSVCWTFGQGENGQLGQGATANQAYPAPVEGLPNERLRTVACGHFHTAVVTETGDVWVWGMEGGLGLCPGIGPPGARSGDALSPVRVFGESSGNCHPVTGSKGITCGAAHTVTMSNGGKDLWAWGRGQSGVLGLGHTSDSWFPCPVVWPPVALAPWSGGFKSGSDALYPMGFDCRKSSRASSRTGSRDRADSAKSSPKASLAVDRKRFEHPAEECALVSEEVEAIKKELAGVRRYAASLHAAVYGEVEVFSQQQPGEPLDSGRHCHGGQSTHLEKHESDVAIQKKKALQEWDRRMEAASDADLTNLDHFYRSMRVRLKEVLFQRKMDEWCRRCMSAINSSGAPVEPPPRRENMYSAASTPSLDGPGEWAVPKAGLHGESGELLPPAASMAEFRMLAGRQR